MTDLLNSVNGPEANARRAIISRGHGGLDLAHTRMLASCFP